MNPVGSASLKAVLIAGIATPFVAFIIEAALLGYDPLDNGAAAIALPIAILVTVFALFVLAFPLTLFVDNGNPERGRVALMMCLGVGVATAILLFASGSAAGRILGLHALVGALFYCFSFGLMRPRIAQNA